MRHKIVFNILIIILFLVPILLEAQISYYESTEYGLPIQEISSSRTDEFEFILIYQKIGERVIRRLLQNDKEIRKWERVVKWKNTYAETEYEKSEIVSRSFIEGGLMAKEEIYFEGQLKEQRIYHYSQRELIKTTVEDAKGKVLYVNKYLTSSNGRLTRVIREEPEESDQVYSYQYSDSALMRMVTQQEAYTFTYRYKAGQLFSIEKKEGNKVVYYREEPINGVRNTLEQDFKADIKVQSSFDKKGNILKKVRWEMKEKNVTLYQYDTNNRMIEKRIRGKGFADLYLYSYDKEGNLSIKKQLRDGKIIRQSKYSSPSNYIQTIYRDEIPLFEVVYIDNVKKETHLLKLDGIETDTAGDPDDKVNTEPVTDVEIVPDIKVKSDSREEGNND